MCIMTDFPRYIAVCDQWIAKLAKPNVMLPEWAIDVFKHQFDRATAIKKICLAAVARTAYNYDDDLDLVSEQDLAVIIGDEVSVEAYDRDIKPTDPYIHIRMSLTQQWSFTKKTDADVEAMIALMNNIVNGILSNIPEGRIYTRDAVAAIMSLRNTTDALHYAANRDTAYMHNVISMEKTLTGNRCVVKHHGITLVYDDNPSEYVVLYIEEAGDMRMLTFRSGKRMMRYCIRADLVGVVALHRRFKIYSGCREDENHDLTKTPSYYRGYHIENEANFHRIGCYVVAADKLSCVWITGNAMWISADRGTIVNLSHDGTTVLLSMGNLGVVAIDNDEVRNCADMLRLRKYHEKILIRGNACLYELALAELGHTDAYEFVSMFGKFLATGGDGDTYIDAIDAIAKMLGLASGHGLMHFLCSSIHIKN
jgi:hypothetical protein